MSALHVRVLGFFLAAFGVALPAFAQSAPNVELSGGYQFLSFEMDEESESMAKGWYFDVTGNLTPTLGIVFQVGGNYKNFEETVSLGGVTATATADVKVHEFLGGLRLHSRSNSKIVPFGQVLVGGVNGSAEVSASTTIPGLPPISFSEEESGTNFGLELGAGVNFGVNDTFGLRMGVDYLRVFEEEDGGANLFRFAVGIVIGQ